MEFCTALWNSHFIRLLRFRNHRNELNQLMIGPSGHRADRRTIEGWLLRAYGLLLECHLYVNG